MMIKEELINNINSMLDYEDQPPPYSVHDAHNPQNTGDVEHREVPEVGPLYKQLKTDLGGSTTQMSSSHDDIVLESGFQGKECRLKTAHSTIHIGNSVIASQSIDLVTSHRALELKASLYCAKSIRLQCSHAPLTISPGNSLVGRDVELKTQHAPLVISGVRIDAKSLKVSTSHSKISLDNVSIESELTAKSSHGPIDLVIKEIYSSCASIKVTTSHAPVNVHLPSNFSGKFYLKTSRSAANTIALGDVTFSKNTNNEKEGIIGSKSNVEVRIETSSNPINLYIK